MTDIAEHVRRVVAESPPLSDEQLYRLAFILHAGSAPPSLATPEPTEQEIERARLTAEAKRIASEVQACAICGTPIFVHPKVRGHEWEPNPLAIAKYAAPQRRLRSRNPDHHGPCDGSGEPPTATHKAHARPTRGNCATCGRNYQLRKDGLVPQHDWPLTAWKAEDD